MGGSIISKPHCGKLTPTELPLHYVPAAGELIADSDGVVPSFPVRLEPLVFFFRPWRWWRRRRTRCRHHWSPPLWWSISTNSPKKLHPFASKFGKWFPFLCLLFCFFFFFGHLKKFFGFFFFLTFFNNPFFFLCNLEIRNCMIVRKWMIVREGDQNLKLLFRRLGEEGMTKGVGTWVLFVVWPLQITNKTPSSTILHLFLSFFYFPLFFLMFSSCHDFMNSCGYCMFYMI